MKAWKVFVGDEHVDTVFFAENLSEFDVVVSLASERCEDGIGWKWGVAPLRVEEEKE